MEKIRRAALVMVLVTVAACAVDNEGATTSAAAGAGAGGQQLGTGGELLGLGGAGQLAAAPTALCPVAEVAGTACSTNGYVYLPGDTGHWCVVCYEWTPPEVHPPVNAQVACLGHLASLPDRPDLMVQCVATCDGCLPCPSGVSCVHP